MVDRCAESQDQVGEVPTPDVVYNSAVINDTFSKREQTKESDFLLEGAEREAALADVEQQIADNASSWRTASQVGGHEADYEAQLENASPPCNRPG